MKTRVLLTLACLPLLAAALRADELTLKDGRVLVGKVTEPQKGMLEIATRDGVVRVPATEVVQRRYDEDLRKALADLAARTPDTPFGHFNLAKQAFAFGLVPELWRHLDAAVQLPRDGAQAPLRARLDDFLAQLEPELLARRFRTAATGVRVHELLQRPRPGRGQHAALLELLRREPNAEKELRGEARRNGDPNHRLLALEALLLRATPGSDSFAWRTSILDPDPGVREQSLALARSFGATTGAVNYLAPGLMHNAAEVRVRTAEALGNLGDPSAMKLLVIAGPNAGKALAAADDGVRAHVAFLNQQAYIRDFDVEVAQASFIADPKIGVLQSGVVLDVTVAGIFEEEVRIVLAYRGALKRLAGADPGANPRGWPAWLMQVQAAPTPPATTPPGTPTAAPKKN